MFPEIGKSGIGIFGLVLVLIIMLITGIVAIKYFKFWPSQFGWIATEETCKGLCKENPKLAVDSACLCGTQEKMGDYLHIKAEVNGKPIVWAFHLTDLLLPEISDYKAGNIADLQDTCDDGGADLENWEEIYEGGGCMIYAVEAHTGPFSGDAACSLYRVPSGTTITGDEGNTIRGEITDLNKLASQGDEEVLGSIEFGEDIYTKDEKTGAGQLYLLQNPKGSYTAGSHSWKTGGRNQFKLWKPLKCVDLGGGNYKWKIVQESD